MTVSCGTLRVWKPANIIATNMIFDTNDCDEPCTVTVTVTWTNTGGRTGSFAPNISIDGTPYGSPYPLENLAGGASVTHAFSITGLTAISAPFTDHAICPIPN